MGVSIFSGVSFFPKLLTTYYYMVSFMKNPTACDNIGKTVKRVAIMASTKGIRKAAHAGSFYPANPTDLCQMVQDFCDKAHIESTVTHPIGLVVPHAGYIFSGQTAAYAYKQLQDKGYERVVVIAPSHRWAFPGASIYDGEAYETPLGTVPIDRETVSALRQTSSLFGFHSHTHRDEHSLEVQLPFLQMILDKFLLVPIVLADQSLANCKDVAATLVKVLSASNRERTVVVASSDLYHGESYDECKARDAQLATALEKFDVNVFMEEIERGIHGLWGWSYGGDHAHGKRTRGKKRQDSSSYKLLRCESR